MRVNSLAGLWIKLGTYINLYSFELSVKWPFSDIFFFALESTKISDYAEGAEHTLLKKIFSANTDFEAISLFRVNSYRTSAKVQTISQQSSFISCSNFSEMEDSPRVTAWLNEGSDVAHCNRKTITTQVDVSVKKSQNYCLRAKPWMGTSFLNFLYVILTYLGGLEKRTKEKTEQTE